MEKYASRFAVESIVIAAIGLVIAAFSFLYEVFSNREELVAPAPTVNINLPETQQNSAPTNFTDNIVHVGNCIIDSENQVYVKASGIYDEILYLCAKGIATNKGANFEIQFEDQPEEFHQINFAELTNQNYSLNDDSASKYVVYEQIAKKVEYCFSSAFETGAGPTERIDLETKCLSQSGISSQDKIFYMIVENFRQEHRNEIS